MVAWDPVARERKWVVRNRFFHNGGILATAGGLVFQGTNEGDFNSYNAASGEKVWSYEGGNGIISGPMSYAVDGEQYVAVLSGYGGGGSDTWPLNTGQERLPGRLLVFKLDGKTEAPAYANTTLAPINVGDATSAGDLDKGFRNYTYYCMVCHGASAANRYNADLRRSAALTDPDLWNSIVLDGALTENGMVGFSQALGPADAEDLRAYVLKEARLAQAVQEKSATDE